MIDLDALFESAYTYDDKDNPDFLKIGLRFHRVMKRHKKGEVGICMLDRRDVDSDLSALIKYWELSKDLIYDDKSKVKVLVLFGFAVFKLFRTRSLVEEYYDTKEDPTV
jgi:hypothetical protein